MNKLSSIGFGLLSLTLVSGFASAQASELKDCEKKIIEMVNQVKATQIKVVDESAEESSPNRIKSETYHMSEDNSCGVELALNDKVFTVYQFEESLESTDNQTVLDLGKFETVILNGNDPTFTGGRVKALVSCNITENGVEYTTKVPTLTDGMKSPYNLEQLSITQTGQEIYVRLRASVTPINGIFRSITDCSLKF